MNPRVMSVSVTCRVSLCCPRCRLGPSSRGRCSSVMLCHTPSHSASFVLIPVAACQAQPQTHTLTTRLSPTPGEPMFTSVRAHLCQILVSPLSCRLTLNQDVQTELQMGKWCMGGGVGVGGAYVLRGLVATIPPTHTVNKIRSSGQSQRVEQQRRRQQQQPEIIVRSIFSSLSISSSDIKMALV